VKPDLPPLPPFNAAEVLRAHGIHPDKGLGQNFLQDDSALRNIVSVAHISGTDTVLEIGSGLGSLTRYLAMEAGQVIAVELDESLIPVLKSVLKQWRNVRVIHGDIVKLELSELIKVDNYSVVANIPYYITSAIMRHLLESHPRPRRIVLTLQKEVAERICAEPGEMSLLALSVQVYGKPEIAAIIPATAFYPAPKVDSSVIRVDIYPEPAIPIAHLETFFRLAKAGFSQKRKTLRNSLSAGLAISTSDTEGLLKAAEIDHRRRAETLSISEWARLASLLVNPRNVLPES
jgi:16S rRNA (adenine1518-N6/adenine1519-N6)-dimethyltransferase